VRALRTVAIALALDASVTWRPPNLACRTMNQESFYRRKLHTIAVPRISSDSSNGGHYIMSKSLAIFFCAPMRLIDKA